MRSSGPSAGESPVAFYLCLLRIFYGTLGADMSHLLMLPLTTVAT